MDRIELAGAKEAERSGGAEWYALRVKPHHEKVSAALLDHKGFEVFLPLFRSRRAWSDRTKHLDLPLFPGYLFSRFPLDLKLVVEKTHGVLSLLASGRSLLPVPEPELDAVRRLLSAGVLIEPWPYLKTGQRVLIERGPLSGIEGIVLERKGLCRLVVSVTLLQRSVSAEIDSRWIRPINPPPLRQDAANQHSPSLA